jgi:ribosomal protein S18 acetylase RimI-like enzyme
MQPKHLEQVLDIEADSFEEPWDENEFLQRTTEPYCFGLVLVRRGPLSTDQVGAFAVVKRKPRGWRLLKFAVLRSARRQGIGSVLMKEIKRHHLRAYRLDNTGPWIVDDVAEENLPMQLFLRSHKFQARRIIRNGHSAGVDTYTMVFKQPKQQRKA